MVKRRSGKGSSIAPFKPERCKGLNLLVAAAAVEAEATAERDADQTDLFNSSCESADEGATTTYPRARVSTKAAGGSLLSWRENKACRFYGLVWYGIITHRGRLFNERVIGSYVGQSWGSKARTSRAFCAPVAIPLALLPWPPACCLP